MADDRERISDELEMVDRDVRLWDAQSRLRINEGGDYPLAAAQLIRRPARQPSDIMSSSS
jgi:hypothetical protein